MSYRQQMSNRWCRLFAAVTVATGCTTSNTGSSEGTQPKAGRIEAKNTCVIRPDRIQIRALIPYRYVSGGVDRQGRTRAAGAQNRVYVVFDCWREIGKCSPGVEFDLDRVDGEGLIYPFHDVRVVDDAKVSATGSLFEISWGIGPVRLLSIDGQAATVRYSETGEGSDATEARGETKCKLD